MITKQYSKIDWSDFQSETPAPVERKMQYMDMELPDLQRNDESITALADER